MGNSLKKHMNISQIESEIREHPVVIYTKSMCAYCKRAKDLLTAVNVAYEEKNLDSMQVFFLFVKSFSKFLSSNLI